MIIEKRYNEKLGHKCINTRTNGFFVFRLLYSLLKRDNCLHTIDVVIFMDDIETSIYKEIVMTIKRKENMSLMHSVYF